MILLHATPPTAVSRSKQRTPIMQTPLFALHMRRGREGLRQALVRTRRVEYLGLPRLLLVHDTRVFEFFNEGFFSSRGGSDQIASVKDGGETYW